MIARGANGVHITEIALHTGNSHSLAHNERVSLTRFDGKLCLLGITEDPLPSPAPAITGVTPRARGGTVVRIWRLPPVSGLDDVQDRRAGVRR